MMYSPWSGGWGAMPFWALGVGALIGLVFLAVVIVLKGFALWHAAKRDEKWWFIILLVINTAGILELVYLLAIAKVWPKKVPSSTGSQPQ